MRNNWIALIVLFILVYACSRTCNTTEKKKDYTYTKSPVDELIKDMTYLSTYSIILYDMNTEGSYFEKYFHQYRIIKEDQAGQLSDTITDWNEVSEEFFMANVDNMGMEIAAKDETGKVSKTAAPAGYSNYVGNEKYGRWVERDGGSFWEFYGKYAFLSSMLNLAMFPVRSTWYNDYYGNYYGRGRPYYGPRNNSGRYAYGTNSSYNTRNSQSKSWYTNKSNQSFKQRVNRSSGRSSSSNYYKRSSPRSSGKSYRSRGGGFGK